jgi:hypothetical protein
MNELEAQRVMNAESKSPRVPSELSAITDVVLAYRPPKKVKATKRREKRRRQRAARKG